MIEIDRNNFIWKHLLSPEQKQKIWFDGGQISVCTLFWKVVWNTIAWTFLFVFLTALGVGFLVATLTSVIDTILIYVPWTDYRLPPDQVGCSIAVNFFIGIYWIGAIICNNIKRGYKKVRKFTARSLALEYVKAKKQRFCPTVKFVEGGK